MPFSFLSSGCISIFPQQARLFSCICSGTDTGNVNSNTLPVPGLLLTVSCPFISFTNFCKVGVMVHHQKLIRTQGLIIVTDRQWFREDWKIWHLHFIFMVCITTWSVEHNTWYKRSDSNRETFYLTNGQANAGATILPWGAAVSLRKGLKQPMLLVKWNAYT